MEQPVNLRRTHKANQPVYIVDGMRTPFLKAQLKPGPFSASDLAVTAGRALLIKQPFAPTAIDEIIVGCVSPNVDEANIGRLIGLRLGCGDKTPGWTVQRNCASGMQSLDSAIKDIALGRANLVLSGGTEAMSHSPLLYNRRMALWFAKMKRAKSLTTKLALFTKLNPAALLTPVVSLLKGLTDPLSGLSMGQTAEELAYQFSVTRDEMDQFALRSHRRAVSAFKAGHLQALTPLYHFDGTVTEKDTGVREDSSIEALAKLKPFFDRQYGSVSAGNSSQVSDGATLLLLASEQAVDRYKLPVLGKVVDSQWAGLNPDVMGLGPVVAATPILQRQQLGLDAVDYWEINEAFAAQVLACSRAWECDSFCRDYLGLESALGKLNEDRLNVSGGAIALGHPVGASGARIVLQLLKTMQREKAKLGMAAICIGGGQGGALLLESV